MIKQINDEAKVAPFQAPASLAFAFNDAVTVNSAGYLAKATASTPRSKIVGLIQQTILSTDDDYASIKTVPVLKPHDKSEFLCDVGTGTPTQAMVGKRYSLKDENEIDVNNQGQRCVEILKYLSATQVIAKFVTDGEAFELTQYQQTISVAEFTDGGSATGTLSLGVTIPAGAVFHQTLVTGIVGFAGDTTAVVTVGDGSDVDRYNTGTPDVFATLVAGIDMGVPSGTKFHSAEKTVVVSVETGTDFGLAVTDGNGQMVVTLFWFQAN